MRCKTTSVRVFSARLCFAVFASGSMFRLCENPFDLVVLQAENEMFR